VSVPTPSPQEGSLFPWKRGSLRRRALLPSAFLVGSIRRSGTLVRGREGPRVLREGSLLQGKTLVKGREELLHRFAYLFT